ncbi:hypothetical protein [Paraburkholderia fungorum]|nr:hypothetical protein [Paraburkholderia fungorum]
MNRMTTTCNASLYGSQHGIGSVSGQSQTAKDQKKRLRALFFRPQFSPRQSSISQFLPSREGIHYNTGHFGAGNTVARRVIKPASPRNCRQETYS